MLCVKTAKNAMQVLLCSAAALNLEGEIQRLVQSGASPDSADYDGRTALHVAASEGEPSAGSM